MDASECTWCGAEIVDGGILHKKLMFCSTECRDDWEDDNIDVGEINLDEFEECDPLVDELEDFEGELPVDVEEDI